MSSEDEKVKEDKKKPKVDYSISDDGNVVQARIDDETSFVSWREKIIKKRKKGGFGLGGLGVKAEGETESENEWTCIVWEPPYGAMPRSVWDEKRRREILEKMRATISVASGVDIKDVRMSGSTGTVLTFQPMIEKCPYCESLIPASSIFCPQCGKRLRQV